MESIEEKQTGIPEHCPELRTEEEVLKAEQQENARQRANLPNKTITKRGDRK